MLRQCVVLAVIGCAVAFPQHQYQQQQSEVPPHLLRQYIGQQQQAQTQLLQQRPQHFAPAPAPARLTYAVQSEDQYQQPQPQYRPAPQPQYRPQPQQYTPQEEKRDPQEDYDPYAVQSEDQYQQPQPQYRPAPQPQYRPQPQQYTPQEEKRDPQEDYDPNPSYQFGFDVNDDQYTNYQNRKEQREGGVIKGSYSVVDSDGFIRTVNYIADPKEGFRAEVSRQPTDIVVKIPTPKPQTQQPISQPQPVHTQHRQQQPQQAPPQYYRYEQ